MQFHTHLRCWLAALYTFIWCTPTGATQKNSPIQLQNHMHETKYPIMKRAEQHMLNRLRHRVKQLEQAERLWPSTNRYHEMRCLQQQIDRLSRDPYQTPPGHVVQTTGDRLVA